MPIVIIYFLHILIFFCFLEDQSFSSISPKYAISLANGKQIQTALCFIAAITGQEGNFPVVVC